MASKLSTLISALTGKTTPVDADKIPVLDSENSFNHNWLSFSSLKTYLSGLYAPIADVEIGAALTDTDTIPVYDTSITTQKKSLVSRLWTYIEGKLTSYSGALTANSLSLSGNISASAWTTSGIRHKNLAATLTDTTSSGTVATAYSNVFGGNTIAASNATVFTDYATFYLSTPVAGTNVTLTNAYSLITQGPVILGGVKIDTNQIISGARGTLTNLQSDSYGLLLIDAGKTILMNKGTAQTLTIPANSAIAFPVGTLINIVQTGAGQLSIAITSDTLNSSGAKVKLTGQYSAATLIKTASTSWVLIGDLSV